MASLNNFSRLWGTVAVPSCLVPGPKVSMVGGGAGGGGRGMALSVRGAEEVVRVWALAWLVSI